jgi:hypothetical protein
MNYKLVKCENCQVEMYFKQPIFGSVSCSNSCTFSLYNKYQEERKKKEENQLEKEKQKEKEEKEE